MANPFVAGQSRTGGWALGLLLGGLALVGSGLETQAASQPRPAAASGLGQAVSPSTPEQKALVEHLLLRGAVFYGAWWCPHCFYQKNLFGTEAGERLPYVECDREEAGRRRCLEAQVRAYPTWELGGEKKEGVLTVEELKAWSGFKAISPTP
ncbi:thioredoxin [Synechococcus sp. CS-1325]|uniref:thioredoxin n=1 Tax=unclassified Synechococcus TaxID=2626047 RepID=UPI0021A27268|nr:MULTISPECIES: thioredoxin [unclassified Synechococcus]MCT0200523.1 thioredoxin [Synechococcus sp. CS-1325]MCT0213433.1 thioredoxin [Synechococcus sp. CS-1326]MCT0231671.1 thioredoxin [Synechococcus sp. CS-1324]MCT0232713.1 thioredoxin [Synechococcus sp. CS-1327]